MKTKYQLIFLLLMSFATFKGVAQCTSGFYLYNVNGGTVGINNFQTPDSIPGLQLNWDFGDGSTSQDSTHNFTHTYAVGGTYHVCLTTTVAGTSCTSTHCDSITINLCQGVSAFNYAHTGFGDYAFNGANLSYVPGATVIWSFGDGATSGLNSPSHHYSTNGSRTVWLKVYDSANSCADSSAQQLNISICDFTNDFIWDSIPNGPGHHFYVYQPVSGYTYNWNFGDGTTGTGDTVIHSYATGNNYTVCLFTNDANTGCVDSICRSLYFDPCGLGQPYISINSNGTTVDYSVYLWGGSGGSLSYQWWFSASASPSTSTSQSGTTTFSQLGGADACVAISGGGCTDTLCQPFMLTAPHYTISGNITRGGAAACAIIYLINEDTIGHLVLVDSVVLSDTLGSCDGNYYFTNLPVDTYFVKAALKTSDPYYANYLPTYYVQELGWANAAAVDLNGGNAVADIALIAGTNPGGAGFIGGWVSQGAGLVATGHGNNGRATGDPLVGVQINLLTNTGQAVAYTYTDGSGHYQFSNLAYGDYSIYAEQLNKVPTPVPVTLSASSPSANNVDIAINSNSAVATNIENLDEVKLIGVYPNPVVTNVLLQLSSKHYADGSLKLTDVLGNVVMQRKQHIVAGDNKINVDMQNFAAGVYQLSLIANGQTTSFKLVKTK